MDGPLTSPSFFVYAEKEDGTPFVSGDSPFCSPSGKFTLPGTANCDFSDIHLFKELDKENATSRVIHFECSDCLDPDLEETIQRLLPSLEDYANASAPSSYETPDWIDVGPADVQFNVARDPFHLQLTGSKLSVHVRARYQIEVSNLVLGSIRFNTASCGIGEEPRIADADVSIVLGVSDDGALLSHSRIDSLSFPNRCTLTAADIDVTDDIEDVVRKQLLEIGREFDAEVRKLDIR